MSKKAQNQAPAARKLTGREFLQKYWHLIAIAIILTITGAWVGYSLESFGGIQKVVKKPERFMEEFLTLESFGKAMLQLLSLEGGAFEGMTYGFIAGLLIFFGFAKPEKRFHRKGVEHGSARWGSQAEKDIIADTNDFFNNVICSSDVMLVLDRKKRDINAMTDKEKSEYEHKRNEVINAETERIKALSELYEEVKIKYDYKIEGD